MKISFQADADLNQIILLALVRKEPAIDFRSATAASQVAEEILLIWSATDSGEWTNRIAWLPL